MMLARARSGLPRFRFLYLSLLIATAVTSEGSAQTTADSLGVTERVYGLSLIWKEAAYNFPYFDQLGALDWDEAYRQFVPRVVAAGSTLSYYRELQRFMALLHDGHSRVQLPDTILQRHPFSSPWVELRAVGGRPMVANVATILVDSLPLDSEVIAVEGLPVDRYLVDSVLPYVFASAQHSRRISAIEGSYTRGYGLLVGPARSHVRITARTPAGELVRLTLFRDRFESNREWVRSVKGGPRPNVDFRWVDPGIAYLALNTFDDTQVVSRIDSLLPELRRARGVIVDLRDNGGGSDAIAGDVLARFTDRPLIGTASRIRVHDAYYRALGSFGRSVLERALPSDSGNVVEEAMRHYQGEAWRYEPADTARPVFSGDRVAAPVAILIGRGTGSAAENFVVRLPDEPRFFTVGTATAASTGQPLVFALPGGGMGQVVTRAALLPNGTPVVSNGIAPDHVTEITIEDVRRGHDPALAEAMRLMKSRTGG
jgi:C-terminal processing protease CtpA/Prc